MKLSDYAGEVRISSNDAKTFVQSWFKADDKICISGLRSERSGSMDAVSQSMTAREFVSTTDDQSLEDTVFGEDGSMWNIYISVCPIKEDVTLKQRGTKSNVDYVPGVWADLDVKEGGFSSQKEILQWLNELELLPTVICSSGSSGVHAYWKLRWDEKGNEALVDSWWSYLDEMAGERKIDKLIDITRILRLPGTIRFPKKEETSGKLGSVSIISIYPDRRYSVSQIQEVSAEAMARKATERKRTIQKIAERRAQVDEMARGLIDVNTHWGYLQAIAHVEDYVNENWQWAHILEPHGWKYRRTLSDGSKEWARPGQSDRSAVVDYEGSPVMSLLSMSESTGLADLKDAGVPLTKYTVALRLMFADDEAAMTQYVVEEQKALATEEALR
jgi:hypothetical protein